MSNKVVLPSRILLKERIEDLMAVNHALDELQGFKGLGKDITLLKQLHQDIFTEVKDQMEALGYFDIEHVE
jgi:hypothetical protein